MEVYRTSYMLNVDSDSSQGGFWRPDLHLGTTDETVRLTMLFHGRSYANQFRFIYCRFRRAGSFWIRPGFWGPAQTDLWGLTSRWR